MTETITILVGTMSGTAELVADTLLDQFEEAGVEGRLVRMEKAKLEQLAAGGVWLICSSTYGKGEVPDNAKSLYAALETDRPDLSEVRYGIISLGDSIYPETFCNGGKLFDEMLASLGAHRVGAVLEHDRTGGGHPEDAANAWAEAWLELLKTDGRKIAQNQGHIA